MEIKIGDRFGRLTVLSCVGYKKVGKWNNKNFLCKCDCGNEVEVIGCSLTSGNTKSCGCLPADHAREISKATCKYGTNIGYLKKHTKRSNNKSGVTGVYQLANGHWAASISLRGIRYYLGQYTTFDEAVQKRKEAENKIYDSFLEWYENEKAS